MYISIFNCGHIIKYVKHQGGLKKLQLPGHQGTTSSTIPCFQASAYSNMLSLPASKLQLLCFRASASSKTVSFRASKLQLPATFLASVLPSFRFHWKCELPSLQASASGKILSFRRRLRNFGSMLPEAAHLWSEVCTCHFRCVIRINLCGGFNSFNQGVFNMLRLSQLARPALR